MFWTPYCIANNEKSELQTVNEIKWTELLKRKNGRSKRF
jgi:hypothetical protein